MQHFGFDTGKEARKAFKILPRKILVASLITIHRITPTCWNIKKGTEYYMEHFSKNQESWKVYLEIIHKNEEELYDFEFKRQTPF